MPGNRDNTHLNLHDQLISLIDMKLHARNQLYNSFTSRDLKVLKASLGLSVLYCIVILYFKLA